MDLAHAVITCVARDDLADGGASCSRRPSHAVRVISPGTNVELLISDCKGDAAALATIFAARPDVLNHNLETVARLQRAARPSAGYARSLSRARARQGRRTRRRSPGIILGMGETLDEVRAAITDLRAVGVDIVTVGQYLRPSAAPPAGRAVVDARRVRRGARLRRGRSVSVTSKSGRSCAPATTPAPQSRRERRRS